MVEWLVVRENIAAHIGGVTAAVRQNTRRLFYDLKTPFVSNFFMEWKTQALRLMKVQFELCKTF
jgi:predicted short-subunit dehydrogenase-like oxidoreductase (DUF2520 family)